MPPGSRQAREPPPPRDWPEIQKSRPLAPAAQRGAARARPLLTLDRVARHHQGAGPWGDGPASGGAKRRVNLGGGGSSWAGCVCRGRATFAQCDFPPAPRPQRARSKAGGECCSVHRGMTGKTRCRRSRAGMQTWRPPATTSLGGGATGVHQRPPTRDSCRTLPPGSPLSSHRKPSRQTSPIALSSSQRSCVTPPCRNRDAATRSPSHFRFANSENR